MIDSAPAEARRGPWKLRTRLGIALLIVFMPMSLLIVLSHLEHLRDRRESKVESFETISETLAASLDGFTRDLESFTLSTAISLSESSAPLTQVQLGPYFKDLSDSYGVLRSIFITDLDGKVVAGTTGNLGYDVSNRDYFLALRGGAKAVWSDAVAGSETGQTTVVLGRPVVVSGQSLYYLFVAFYPSQLLARLPHDLPQNANVSLLGKNGVVLFTSRDGGPGAPLRDVSDSTIFAAASEGNRVTVRSERTPLDDSKSYGSFVPLDRTGWIVGFTVPASSVDGPLQSRLWRDILIAVVVLAGGSATMLVIASRLSTPLSNLAAAATAIARGEVPVVPTAAADADVQKLESAMASMSGAIAMREQNLRTIAEAGVALAENLDYDETLTRLAHLLVPGVADWCAIYVDEGGAVRQLAIANKDPNKIAAALDLQALYPDDAYAVRGAGYVIRTGRPILVRRVSDEMLALGATNDEHSRQLRALGVTSYMCVPMRGGDGILGAMMLVTAESGRTYTDLDLNLAEELGRRAGAAITNARLYRDSQAAREELARSNQAKDEFLGILAHELRTPLTSIFGGARLLNNKSRNLPDRARADLLETIETEASKMTRLIENLLLLARTEMGKAPDTQKFSLQDLVVRVAADIHTSRPDRLILFDDQTLPPIWSDPTRLEQVIYNLISNADKYSPLAEPIEVKINLRPDSVTVRVLDRGPGASPGEINLLFESFYRSSATAGSAPGKGIGLAVCRRLVESLSGSIWARNRPGGGLEAGFSVPIQAPTDNAEEAGPSRLGLSGVAAN